VLREQAGLDLVTFRPASGGESRSTFWVTDRAGAVSVLKILRGAAPRAVGHLHAVDATAARLRDRGYPAPRLLAVGQAPGLVFWVQQRLPGSVLDRGQPEPDHDRAFDLATLLFYLYDHDGIRARLRARLLELTGPRAARAYLGHMVLRQVDWSLRHHSAAPATRRHLRLARLVTADIARGPATRSPAPARNGHGPFS
jgi:Phosphotransferase enzyme family